MEGLEKGMVEDKEELFELQMVAILDFVFNISEILQNKTFAKGKDL